MDSMKFVKYPRPVLEDSGSGSVRASSIALGILGGQDSSIEGILTEKGVSDTDQQTLLSYLKNAEDGMDVPSNIAIILQSANIDF